jgi:calcium-dependent protein kinase
LKLENFLFEDNSSDAQLKLIDFGLGQHFVKDEVLHSSVGTPYYVPPEILAGNYDARCDVWSIGVIAYMLLSGTPPFNGRSDREIIESVKSGKFKFPSKYFDQISKAAKDFISNCLTIDVAVRPTG